MAKSNNAPSVGSVILQIALAAFFIVSGIYTLQGGTGDEAAAAIKHLFSGNVSQIVCVIFGVIELFAGVILLIKLFVNTVSVMDAVLMFIVMAVWIVAIVLIDILGSGGLLHGCGGNILSYCRNLSQHLLVLGAIFIVKD